MKKMLLFAAFVLCGVSWAAEIDVNGSFTKVAGTMPAGWVQNKGNWSKPWGTVKVVAGSNEKSKAVNIVSLTKQTPIYLSRDLAVKAGDKLEISFRAKGNGVVAAGAYLYLAPGKWTGNDAKYFKLTADWQSCKMVLTVKNIKQKDGADKVISMVRPMIEAAAKADVTVEGLKIVKL